MTGILVYALIGLAIGAVTRFAKAEEPSLARMLGAGGAGGLIGGVLADLLFTGQISLDIYGLAGSVILSLVAVLVIRSASRTPAPEPPPPAS